jgi:hypothetical protein
LRKNEGKRNKFCLCRFSVCSSVLNQLNKLELGGGLEFLSRRAGIAARITRETKKKESTQRTQTQEHGAQADPLLRRRRGRRPAGQRRCPKSFSPLTVIKNPKMANTVAKNKDDHLRIHF